MAATVLTHRHSVIRGGVDLRAVARVVGFAVLLALAARVRFYPPGHVVPVTLQTLVVLLCGFWLRPAGAMSAVVLYVIAGLIGAPVFAAFEAGKTVVTLGYLVGFVVAAGVVSFAVRSVRPRGLGGLLSVAFVGTGLIFLFGVTWIALLRRDLGVAIGVGLLPFWPWALVKMTVAAGLVWAAPLRWRQEPPRAD